MCRHFFSLAWAVIGSVVLLRQAALRRLGAVQAQDGKAPLRPWPHFLLPDAEGVHQPLRWQGLDPLGRVSWLLVREGRRPHVGI